MPLPIVITGAGIAGLSTALALAKRGILTVVFERVEKLQAVGAGIQLSPNASAILQGLGLAADLAPYIYSPRYLVLRHYKSGHYYLRYKVEQHNRQAPYWHIHRADLQKVLLQHCQRYGVEIRYGTEVTHYIEHSNHTSIYLGNSQPINAQLLISADGVHSNLYGGNKSVQYSGFVAWRGSIDVTKLPFVITDSCVWAGVDKHLVYYPIRGGKLINIVAVTKQCQWQSKKWQILGDKQSLLQSFLDFHPQPQAVLLAAVQYQCWGIFHSTVTPQWGGGRTVCIGDASHPLLPFLAQGGAMAIEDAMQLAQLVDNGQTVAYGEQMHKLRSARILKVQRWSQRNVDIFHLRSNWCRHWQFFKLYWVRQIPLLYKLALRWLYDYRL